MEQVQLSDMQEKDRVLLIFFTDIFKAMPGAALREQTIPDPRTYRPFLLDRTILIKIGMFLLFLLLLIGNEIVKIVCRKDIGKGELSGFRVVLSGLFLALIPVIFWTCHYEIVRYSLIPTPDWLIVIYSSSYFYFAINVWEKGYLELKFSDDINPDYPGTSKSFLKKISNGARKSVIRNWHEPKIFLFTGLLLVLVNPFIGFPLVAIALGYWITLLLEYFKGYEHIRTLNENTPVIKKEKTDASQAFVS